MNTNSVTALPSMATEVDTSTLNSNSVNTPAKEGTALAAQSKTNTGVSPDLMSQLGGRVGIDPMWNMGSGRCGNGHMWPYPPTIPSPGQWGMPNIQQLLQMLLQMIFGGGFGHQPLPMPGIPGIPGMPGMPGQPGGASRRELIRAYMRTKRELAQVTEEITRRMLAGERVPKFMLDRRSNLQTRLERIEARLRSPGHLNIVRGPMYELFNKETALKPDAKQLVKTEVI